HCRARQYRREAGRRRAKEEGSCRSFHRQGRRATDPAQVGERPLLAPDIRRLARGHRGLGGEHFRFFRAVERGRQRLWTLAEWGLYRLGVAPEQPEWRRVPETGQWVFGTRAEIMRRLNRTVSREELVRRMEGALSPQDVVRLDRAEGDELE